MGTTRAPVPLRARWSSTSSSSPSSGEGCARRWPALAPVVYRCSGSPRNQRAGGPPAECSMSESSERNEGSEPSIEIVGADPDTRFYFVFYWVREEGWTPRESLIALHPLDWLAHEKRETMNHIHLASWQEIDRQTYLQYHGQLNSIDEEFKEPT